MACESIPADFPRGEATAALSGAQPKLAVRLDSGLYVAGPTDEELAERYDVCSDLVVQLVDKCRRNRQSKYASMTEKSILSDLFDKLKKSGWGTRLEMAWVIRHIASELGWPPLDAAEQLLIPEQGQPPTDA